MSGISGAGGPGGPGGAAGAAAADAAEAADAATAADAAASVSGGAPAQAATAATPAQAAAAAAPLSAARSLFDQVAAWCAQQPGTDLAQAVRQAVEAVIADALPALAPAQRAALVDQVTAAVADDPGLSARFDRLLRPAV